MTNLYLCKATGIKAESLVLCGLQPVHPKDVSIRPGCTYRVLRSILRQIVMGKVTSHNTGGMLNGFSTIRVINVANGEILASFHRPSGLLIAYSEHQCVMEAVSQTAEDVVKALK